MKLTREQYDAIHATVLAAQQDDGLPAHFYVSEILAIVSAELTDNQTALRWTSVVHLTGAEHVLTV